MNEPKGEIPHIKIYRSLFVDLHCIKESHPSVVARI